MIRVGIFFGGKSREREISFAGGRTVYDSLDKSMFIPVPIFVDGMGNLIELEWQYIYKGTIRDFFPPAEFVPVEEHDYQIYTESLGDKANDIELLESIGKKLNPAELKNSIDIAFLALHGPYGEDGFLQGMLDYYNIAYTGSGVYASSVGISKALQKRLMEVSGIRVNGFSSFSRTEFDQSPEKCFNQIKHLQFPVVVKASSQGSSIGVHFLDDCNQDAFEAIVNKALFRLQFESTDWNHLTKEEKEHKVRNLLDLQHGLGLPVRIDGRTVNFHHEAVAVLNDLLADKASVKFESLHGENKIVVEEKLQGKEFSCIVVRDENGKALALPPTEIRKKHDLFDYRSKYLPGITRKVTPIEIQGAWIERIRTECTRLFEFLEFNVYARIDGFITDQGEVFLNDPNTTSGMMPSSFFFHQAAEIGLNPTQFLSYILHQSFVERRNSAYSPFSYQEYLNTFNGLLSTSSVSQSSKRKVGVVFGGYSSERHISVESGRNVFEKLSSSGKYETIPIFLTKDENDELALYQVPINLMLKDNADDIKDKIASFKIDPVIHEIIKESESISSKFAGKEYDFYPRKIELSELAEVIDFAFMALHGRPGEDGTFPKQLERFGIPYNGSRPHSSSTTIDKYRTNEILLENGVLVAKHRMVFKEDWNADTEKILADIESEYNYPLIAKPADDGCSSAVKKIKTRQELVDFSEAIFRSEIDLSVEQCEKLDLKVNEEFPLKTGYLIEELISDNGAAHFLEITGGMLIHVDAEGNKTYDVFESSEAVAEGGILSLEEKFLAGEGQNITPARYAGTPVDNAAISTLVKAELAKTADLLEVEGYCRIDAFVRIFSPEKVEVVVIEINSLPGLTPATAIFHQAALAHLKPAEFLDKLIAIGTERKIAASA